MAVDDRPIRDLVEQVVTTAGYDLEQLTITAAGRRRQVKVVIDRDEGVDLDQAADLSRAISEQLDGLEDNDGAASPLGSAPYVLEVTSPGIGRALTLPRHFRRAHARLLSITTSDGEEFQGRVRGTDAERVELLVDPHGTTPRSVAFTDIAKAKVEVEFNPPPAAVLALLGQNDDQDEEKA